MVKMHRSCKGTALDVIRELQSHGLHLIPEYSHILAIVGYCQKRIILEYVLDSW